MARYTQHHPTFQCADCQSRVQIGDQFCGTCGRPQLVRCPNLNCGRWTQYSHQVCPRCGTALHRGMTFEEHMARQTLEQELEYLQRSHENHVVQLEALLQERRGTILRAAIVVFLSIFIAMIAANYIAAIRTSMATIIIVLVLVMTLFRRTFFALVFGLFGLGQWAEGGFGEVNRKIEEERAALLDLDRHIAENQEVLARLKHQEKARIQALLVPATQIAGTVAPRPSEAKSAQNASLVIEATPKVSPTNASPKNASVTSATKRCQQAPAVKPTPAAKVKVTSVAEEDVAILFDVEASTNSNKRSLLQQRLQARFPATKKRQASATEAPAENAEESAVALAFHKASMVKAQKEAQHQAKAEKAD